MIGLDVLVGIKQRLAEKKRPTLQETRRLIALIDRQMDEVREAREQAHKATEYEYRLAELIPQWNGLLGVLNDVAGIAVVGIAVNPDQWQAQLDGEPAGPTFPNPIEAYAWALQRRLGHQQKREEREQ